MPGMLAAASSAQAPLPEKVGILDREARYRNTWNYEPNPRKQMEINNCKCCQCCTCPEHKFNCCKCYTYAEHRFRFAAWAAARAVKKLSAKESTEKLTTILTDILRDKKIGFHEISGKDNWLLEIDDFDTQHAYWRDRICKLANKKQIIHTDLDGEGMSHGQAAKLINIFIKTLMPPDMYSLSSELRECWGAVHPPIDSIMLKNLDKCKQCKLTKIVECRCKSCRFIENAGKWKEYTWTQLGSCDYENLIQNIKKHEQTCLWKIERFWKL